MTDWTAMEGTPFPLGATWVEKASAWNFALYSKDAESVTLLLYAEADLVNPVFTYHFDYLRNKSGESGTAGSPKPSSAARATTPIRWPAPSRKVDSPGTALTRTRSCSIPTPRRSSSPQTSTGQRLRVPVPMPARRPWACSPAPASRSTGATTDGRGISRTPSSTSCTSGDSRTTRTPGSVRTGAAPTAGVIDKIPYLKDLGITAVELMPVFQCDPQERSCWGYMPLNFFTPHDRYSSRPEECDQHNEFRAMVKALHAADIEVILDVVYNHTAEGDQHGPGLQLQGHRQQYLLPAVRQPGQARTRTTPEPATRCAAEPAVRKLVVDSARYWFQEMHVDGFRFDLASALARNDDGSLNWEDPIDLASA